MATSTFDKRIVINKKEAKILAKELKKKPAGPPVMPKGFWEDNERKVKEWLSSFEK